MKSSHVVLIASLALGACQGEDKRDRSQNHHSSDAMPKPLEATENGATGNYRGYEEINHVVNERLFARADALALSSYIEDPQVGDSIFELGKPTLRDLLGVYDGDGLRVGLRNGTPNSVNMLLWYMAMDGLAAEMAATCEGRDGLHFTLVDVQSKVTEVVNKLCTWPDAQTRDEATLRELWNTVMRSDAPETEYLAWRNFVTGPSFTEAGAPAVHAMLLAILYNPHFLLKK